MLPVLRLSVDNARTLSVRELARGTAELTSGRKTLSFQPAKYVAGAIRAHTRSKYAEYVTMTL